jgi:hypothetical protein
MRTARLGAAAELIVRRLGNPVAIDDEILGVWQSQGDLSEYIVFQADGTYLMVIPGVPALGTSDSVQAEGRFTTDCAKKPPHLDLAVGREWQFFIYEIHGDELRLDGAHDAAACLPSSRPTSFGTEVRRFSRVLQGQTTGHSR